MRLTVIFIAIITSITFISCAVDSSKVMSPNEEIAVKFHLSNEGAFFYTISYKDKPIIDTSYVGFDFTNAPSLKKGFIARVKKPLEVNETWEMPWGEQLSVLNNYNEIKIELEEKFDLQRRVNLVFRVFNDGVGFRYEFPKQPNLKKVLIKEENTEFNLTKDYKTFWIPGDWDIYEHLYSTTKLSDIDAKSYIAKTNLAQSFIPENAVNTPVTLVDEEEGVHLSFHEAALVDYSGMTLQVDTLNLSFKSELVGSENKDYKVKRNLPFHTPWRTIQITDNAPDLIESNLIVNLNEPNKIGDVSWFTPMKYTGIWWEMHLGKSSWDYGMEMVDGKWKDTGKAHGKHGATTENAKRFIDFSAKNNIGGVLVEGWNTGWERWIGFEDREGVFDFLTPYPDYDLDEVTKYAKEKGVQIIMHHETSAATQTYEKQLEKAYQLMQDYGMHAVKSGYVGKILPKGEYHHGQYMVNHYNKAAIEAAKYQVAVNAHEPIKATGLRRTYPNIISREGLRGQEFNAWSADGGNPPEHLSIVAFTRMLAGPIDFTPGIFDIKFNQYKKENQVNTTIAHQLALYVIVYSPIQMAADLVENYEANPAAFQFIKEVGVDWSETKVLNGEVGDYVTIARKERRSNNWFIGGITDENTREVTLNFNFLDENKNYEAVIYKDGKEAHWNENPLDLEIEKNNINSTSEVIIKLAEGGGFAISLTQN